ncbi:unnamed protein product [Meloidogyne enterolobii]|uniref:Uncharacterized protein n=1 Tax=Meloidogyne enterolobii TaxID=390850 RepID=A0ACB1B0E4_MELEN
MEKLFSSQLPTNNEKEEESQLKINNTSKEDNNEDANLDQPKEPKSPEFCVLIV